MAAPVSVIIPCYRCADTIGRAVESVVNQTLRPAEILLVDDASPDNTLSTLNQLRRRFQGEASIRVISLPRNSGPGGARNAGWDAATQPYIAFLDADDSWHPSKLEIQCKWMDWHPEVALTGHPSVQMDPGNAPPDAARSLNARPVAWSSLLVANRFPTRSVMLRREISNRFVPDKRFAEDYLLWLQIVKGGNQAWLLDLPLAYSYKADFGHAGLSANLWEMERGELDTYRSIYMDGSISRMRYSFLVFFSMLKYLRRLWLSIWQS